MTSCVVLNDAAVHDILMNLNAGEISTFLDRIASSLKDFSTGGERQYQPEPAIVNRADGRRNLFRLFTSSTGVGVKIIVDPSQALRPEELPSDPAERNRFTGLHGLLALCDQNGFPSGFINAEEVTGYRTTMSAMILYVRRKETSNIVLFGAGKQALWHIRLALALRGNEISKITVVNRSKDRTDSLLTQIKEENASRWKASVEFDGVLSSDNSELERILGEADVVFCTTPSKQILFPANLLTERKTGRYVSAIGSWQANMIELDPQLLKHTVENSDLNGMVIVDDREACLKDTGELTQSGLAANDVTEVGEVLEKVDKFSGDAQNKLKRCLEEGVVIYKSVGVSMTDLAAGQALLALAKSKGHGVPVPDF